MKQISLTRQNFPPPNNGTRNLFYTKKALLRAVVAAGQKPRLIRNTKGARYDAQMRMSALLSSVDTSGENLKPTLDFLSSGSTEKAHKSFYVGNALCAHAAYMELKIPWLIDIENIDTKKYKLSWSPKSKGRRPDFIGHDVQRRWFVFESKGRTRQPTGSNLKDWKEQAEAIVAVNNKKVTHNIVSAAYLKWRQEWEILWDDPVGESEGVNIELPDTSFFDAYYSPLQQLISRANVSSESSDGMLAYIPEFDAYVGLHKDLLQALNRQDTNSILSFARERINSELDVVDNRPVSTFADGILIALAGDINKAKNHRSNDLQSTNELRSPNPKGELPMNRKTVDRPERETQNRVVALFKNELGYRYLGDRTDFANSNTWDEHLAFYLAKAGYSETQISRAVEILKRTANSSGTLYERNQEVYKLLRYGVPVKEEAGKVTESVFLINWEEPHKNDFAIAEEVTLRGNFERRPDVVLYVNGIAIGILELKRSSVSIGDGIYQNLSNQNPEFNEWFFSTIQLVMAGNNSEGLQYGTIKTEAKYFLKWKEDEQDNAGYKLDKYLLKLCEKTRLLELIHDFVVFDGGVKKLPRPHQYFGIKAAQEFVRSKEGGIIWHTQGSGKSIVMVLLAKWILENNPNARVVIITDRDELDKQIERVFLAAGEAVKRTQNGNQLMSLLGKAAPRLICSLVHKFGQRNVDDFDGFIKEMQSQPSKTVGEVFVFVDECHRTQSGKLHRAMKAIMPNAVFIGFTGTPLLKKDKQTSLEVFGKYIHTYKFSEGVEDGIILDLVYEARDIEQRLTSQTSVDEWFELVSHDLNDWQKAELKSHWGTMQNVLSSEGRMRRVIQDIILDFRRRRRLSDGRGNALLVASSIYEACKYFTLLQRTPFKGKCAVVTSYNPQAGDVTLEETGANSETDKQFIYNTYKELLKDTGKANTEAYEEWAKGLFIKEPANMKLLVVVDKLLTGFDAPPCTYLYIDKSMQDHGLFQAICRVNRLDGEDKDFGYIVDYKNLLPKVESAIQVYTSDLDDSAGGASPEVTMQDRLKKGKERLDSALEALFLLCEPVNPPKGDLEHIHYFCGNTELPESLKEHEPQRVALYKSTVALIRAYANIADELEPAGYSAVDITRIKEKVDSYLRLREIIRRAAEETLDLKAYEADMRHLIDTYIEADEPRKISPFENIGLLELVTKLGILEAIKEGLSNLNGNREAIAETIENNVRSKIIKEQLTDPAYYEKMSALLDEIIAARKAKAIEYEEYLRRIGEVATQVNNGRSNETPAQLDTPGKVALWNNLGQNEELALNVDKAIKRVRRDDWRGNQAKENEIKAALLPLLGNSPEEVLRIFNIVFQKENGY